MERDTLKSAVPVLRALTGLIHPRAEKSLTGGCHDVVRYTHLCNPRPQECVKGVDERGKNEDMRSLV